MKNLNFILKFLMIALVTLGLTSCTEVQKTEQTVVEVPEWTKDSVIMHVQNWKDTPKGVAGSMVDKYGIPDEISDTRLIWHDSGDFAMTVLTNEEIEHAFPMPHKDCLKQVVNYDVPLDKYTDMAKYDGSVILERTKGTMAARCDKEMANYLALNLAHEIATNTKTVEEARSFYAETIQAVMNGETPEYTQKLIFVPQTDTGDPDVAVKQGEEIVEMK